MEYYKGIPLRILTDKHCIGGIKEQDGGGSARFIDFYLVDYKSPIIQQNYQDLVQYSTRYGNEPGSHNPLCGSTAQLFFVRNESGDNLSVFINLNKLMFLGYVPRRIADKIETYRGVFDHTYLKKIRFLDKGRYSVKISAVYYKHQLKKYIDTLDLNEIDIDEEVIEEVREKDVDPMIKMMVENIELE